MLNQGPDTSVPAQGLTAAPRPSPQVLWGRRVGQASVCLLLGVMLGACTRSETSDDQDVVEVPECQAYAVEYKACLERLGPGASSVAAERLGQLRTSFRIASDNTEQRAGLAKSCTVATQALRSSCQ